MNASAFNSRFSTLLFIAWRNIWRNPVRSLLTISALAGGLVMVILYACFLEGMSRQMTQFATEISTGHIQIHRRSFVDDQDLYATLPWSYLSQLEQRFPAYHFAPRMYAAGLASSEQTSTGVMIKAVDPQREPQVTRMLQHVREGKVTLQAMTQPDGSVLDSVVIGAQLAKNMNVGPGDELILVTQAADGSIGNGLYHIAAVLKPLEPNFDRTGVLLSLEAYTRLMYLQEGFHELVVKIDDINQLLSVQQQITQAMRQLTEAQPLDELGGQPLVRNWRELMPTLAQMLELSKTMVLIVGFIVVGLASLGMLNTMLMAVHERKQEFGILLALGMKHRWLLLMVLLESLFLALVSALAGSLVGVLLAQYFQTHGIDFSSSMPDGYDWGGVVFEPIMYGYLEPTQVVFGCVLMVVVAMLSSLIPSWRTVRLKPAEVMR